MTLAEAVVEAADSLGVAIVIAAFVRGLLNK
jgi:hypothetical protein